MQSTKKCSKKLSTPWKLKAVNKLTLTSAHLRPQLSCFMRAPLWLRDIQESEPSWRKTRWQDCLCACSCFFHVPFCHVCCNPTCNVHNIMNSMLCSTLYWLTSPVVPVMSVDRKQHHCKLGEGQCLHSFGNACCQAACYSREELSWLFHQQRNSQSSKACSGTWALKCVANGIEWIQNAGLHLCNIQGCNLAADQNCNFSQQFVQVFFWLECVLVNLGHLQSNTVFSFARKLKTCLVLKHKPASANHAAFTKILCCISQR